MAGSFYRNCAPEAFFYLRCHVSVGAHVNVPSYWLTKTPMGRDLSLLQAEYRLALARMPLCPDLQMIVARHTESLHHSETLTPSGDYRVRKATELALHCLQRFRDERAPRAPPQYANTPRPYRNSCHR